MLLALADRPSQNQLPEFIENTFPTVPKEQLGERILRKMILKPKSKLLAGGGVSKGVWISYCLLFPFEKEFSVLRYTPQPTD